jgi:exodeoxyribonuclease VII large subunit
MSQLPLFQTPTWSVTELTHYLRELLEEDEQLQDTWVQGEVSNYMRHSSGHVYFTLKDQSSELRCVMWRNQAQRQAYLPRNGDAIEAHGSISIFEAKGQYQLYADALRPAGEGRLYQEFLRLKSLLEAEGLFAPERKRPIPAWPQRIGIVTSPTGAALRDMLITIRRRCTLVEVVLAPCAVQGAEAPGAIAAALADLNRLAHPDVILVARGGGSLEDLAAFNDERVARAVAASQAPVISGVGHETDVTICDFVSDLRAATPTAAAELATPDLAEMEALRADLDERAARAVSACVEDLRWELKGLQSRLARRSPEARIRNDRQRLDDWSRRATLALGYRLNLQRLRLAGLEQRAAALNPLAVLKRGYAIVSLAGGQALKSVGQVQPGTSIQVRLADGTFAARAEGETAGEEHGV